ncbi:hypothetical protein GQ53DRAFT_155529 [Thozetella sp. PMI_491]|nr:hypothetical protein GQ53DRAFT_155529 [Thozetella sp. PMI_491]
MRKVVDEGGLADERGPWITSVDSGRFRVESGSNTWGSHVGVGSVWDSKHSKARSGEKERHEIRRLRWRRLTERIWRSEGERGILFFGCVVLPCLVKRGWAGGWNKARVQRAEKAGFLRSSLQFQKLDRKSGARLHHPRTLLPEATTSRFNCPSAWICKWRITLSMASAGATKYMRGGESRIFSGPSQSEKK